MQAANNALPVCTSPDKQFLKVNDHVFEGAAQLIKICSAYSTLLTVVIATVTVDAIVPYRNGRCHVIER